MSPTETLRSPSIISTVMERMEVRTPFRWPVTISSIQPSASGIIPVASTVKSSPRCRHRWTRCPVPACWSLASCAHGSQGESGGTTVMTQDVVEGLAAAHLEQQELLCGRGLALCSHPRR